MRQLVVTFTLAALVATGCTRDPQEKARKYVASGDAYTAKEQYKQALIEYKRAVQAKPDWPEAHFKLAKAYDQQGDPANAYREYARTGDLDPTNIDVRYRFASGRTVSTEAIWHAS